MISTHPLMRPLFASLSICAIAAAWIAYGRSHADSLTGSLALTAGKNHFAVTLDFPPEAFHVTRLQAIGRVIEVRGPTIFMMDVGTADIREFAEFYWVKNVALWPGR